MGSKSWVSVAVAAVLAVTWSAAVPLVAAADVGAEPTSTEVSCPTVIAGDPLNCTGSVTGTNTNTPPPDGDVVTFAFDRGGLADAQCVLDNGSCTVTVVPGSAAEGLLTVTATYPGGAAYDASSTSTSVDVLQPTRLVAKPAIANLISPTKVNLAMSARLSDAVDDTPLAGETVYFWASNSGFCEAITDAFGVATCSSITDAVDASLGYHVRYAPSVSYRLGSTTTGSGVRI